MSILSGRYKSSVKVQWSANSAPWSLLYWGRRYRSLEFCVLSVVWDGEVAGRCCGCIRKLLAQPWGEGGFPTGNSVSDLKDE